MVSVGAARAPTNFILGWLGLSPQRIGAFRSGERLFNDAIACETKAQNKRH